MNRGMATPQKPPTLSTASANLTLAQIVRLSMARRDSTPLPTRANSA